MKTKLFAATVASMLVGFTAAPAFAQESSVGDKIDDAALVTKIKANLLSSSDVDGLDVNVDAKNGVVTLSGTATSEAERTAAVRIARSADGVKAVDNRIMVKPSDKAMNKADKTAPANPAL